MIHPPTVTYNGGESTCSVVLSGSSVSSEVHLDTSVAALGATYITLTSQSKVVLQNRSNMPVKFAWKVLGIRCSRVWYRCGLVPVRTYAREMR